MSNFDSFVDSLANDPIQTRACKPEQHFPCGQCAGTCSCCGRELTNHTSIEAGIGPICAQKWGF